MPDVEEQTVEIEIPTEPTHEGLPSQSKGILCGIDDCNEQAADMEALKAHMRAVHPAEGDKPKHAGGRPCKFCEDSEKYLNLATTYLTKSRAKTGEKVAIPFVEELADILDVDSDTVTNWVQKTLPESSELEHPEFAEVIKKILSLQKLRLLQRTLGRFNPTGAIFQLKVNHGLIESEKKILTGDSKEPLIIEIVNDDKNKGVENE